MKTETEKIDYAKRSPTKWEFEIPFYKYQKEIEKANETEMAIIELYFERIERSRKEFNEARSYLENWEKSAENYLKSLQK